MIAATDCTYGSCTSSNGLGVLVLVMVLFYVAILAAMIWLYARIIGKTGYSKWWVLLIFVPIGNLVGLVLFAVKEWPIEQELRLHRMGAYTGQVPVGVAPYGAGYGLPAVGADPYAPGSYPAAPGTYPTAPGTYGYGAPGTSAPGAYGDPNPYGTNPGTDPSQRPPSWG